VWRGRDYAKADADMIEFAAADCGAMAGGWITGRHLRGGSTEEHGRVVLVRPWVEMGGSACGGVCENGEINPT
jgi:hypothetical protein